MNPILSEPHPQCFGGTRCPAWKSRRNSKLLVVVGKSEGSCCNKIVEEIGDVSKRHPLGHFLSALHVLERFGRDVRNWGLTLDLVGVTVTCCWRDILLVTVVGKDTRSGSFHF